MKIVFLSLCDGARFSKKGEYRKCTYHAILARDSPTVALRDVEWASI